MAMFDGCGGRRAWLPQLFDVAVVAVFVGGLESGSAPSRAEEVRTLEGTGEVQSKAARRWSSQMLEEK